MFLQALKTNAKFVAAVSIGKAYTKVAWVLARDKQVHIFDKWPNSQGGIQVPTAVLCKPAQQKTGWDFVAFGQEAIEQYTYMKDENCIILHKQHLEPELLVGVSLWAGGNVAAGW